MLRIYHCFRQNEIARLLHCSGRLMRCLQGQNLANIKSDFLSFITRVCDIYLTILPDYIIFFLVSLHSKTNFSFGFSDMLLCVVAAKHKETKQFYTMYNTLEDTKVYLEKEVSFWFSNPALRSTRTI